MWLSRCSTAATEKHSLIDRFSQNANASKLNLLMKCSKLYAFFNVLPSDLALLLSFSLERAHLSQSVLVSFSMIIYAGKCVRHQLNA